MKQIFTSLLGFSLLALTTASCTKESHDATSRQQETAQVIEANVPAGQTYVLNLGPGSTASIKMQSLHHQLSEIATASGGNTVYRYTAAKGYSGADAVTLQQTVTAKAHSGSCNRDYRDERMTTTVKTISIKLNVAN